MQVETAFKTQHALLQTKLSEAQDTITCRENDLISVQTQLNTLQSRLSESESQRVALEARQSARAGAAKEWEVKHQTTETMLRTERDELKLENMRLMKAQEGLVQEHQIQREREIEKMQRDSKILEAKETEIKIQVMNCYIYIYIYKYILSNMFIITNIRIDSNFF